MSGKRKTTDESTAQRKKTKQLATPELLPSPFHAMLQFCETQGLQQLGPNLYRPLYIAKTATQTTGTYTQSYRKWRSIHDFAIDMVEHKTCPGGESLESVEAELRSQIPKFTVDRHMSAYLNGVYFMDVRKFIPHTDTKKMSKMTLGGKRIAAMYNAVVFDVQRYKGAKSSTPMFDRFFCGFNKEERTCIFSMLGRLFFDIHDRDKWNTPLFMSVSYHSRQLQELFQNYAYPERYWTSSHQDWGTPIDVEDLLLRFGDAASSNNLATFYEIANGRPFYKVDRTVYPPTYTAAHVKSHAFHSTGHLKMNRKFNTCVMQPMFEFTPNLATVPAHAEWPAIQWLVVNAYHKMVKRIGNKPFWDIAPSRFKMFL